MHPLIADDRSPVRWGAYLILIAIAVGGMTGRILSVNAVDRLRLEQHLKAEHEKTGNRPDWQQQRPFLSGNDRSRWATARSLVEHGTYAIDQVIAEPNWDTIDMVKHDGRLYSSKPPLLATLMAGPYWIIHHFTGATLGTHPFEIGRALLLAINVLPLLICFLALGRLVERFGTTDWGRIYVMAAATTATFLSTFAIAINNHLIAAVSALLALAAAVPIWFDGERRLRYFAAAGFFAAFAAANELPAAAFLGLLGLGLLWKAPARTLVAGLPAAALVGAAFFGTNYLAHGSLRPPYAHRGDGPRLRIIEDADGSLAATMDAERVTLELMSALSLSREAAVEVDEPGTHWTIIDPLPERRFSVRADSAGLAVHAWDNWYNYTYQRGGKTRESYWKGTAARSPVDKGEASRGMYALHVFVGHHGIFSLTPVWLLSVVGIGMALRRSTSPLRPIAALVATASAVCLAFYLAQGTENRNYGGTTSGLRWMFWFAPLWALAMLPAVDAASAKRWSRGLCLVLLALSVVSVSYPTWNPWTHPWLVNLMNSLGWSAL